MIDLHTEIRHILAGKTMIAETATKLALEPGIVANDVLEDGFKRGHLVNFLTTALCRVVHLNYADKLTESELAGTLTRTLGEVVIEFIKSHKEYTPKAALGKYLQTLQAQLHSISSELESFEIEEEKEELPRDRQAYERLSQKTAMCAKPKCGRQGVLKVRLQDEEYFEVIAHENNVVHRQRKLTEKEARRLSEEYGADGRSEILRKEHEITRHTRISEDGRSVARASPQPSTYVLSDKQVKCVKQGCGKEGYRVAHSETKGKGTERRYHVAVFHRDGSLHREKTLSKESFDVMIEKAKPVPSGAAARKFWNELNETN